VPRHRLARCRAWRALHVGAAALCAGGASQAASAQIIAVAGASLFRQDAAGTRVEPQFEPPPVDVAGMTLQLEAATGLGGDTNVYRSRVADGDVVFAASGLVGLRADLGPDSVLAHARVGTERFFRLATANADTYDLGVDSSAALSQQASLSTDLSYARQIEPRGSSGFNPTDVSPSTYRQLRAGVTAHADLGALAVTVPVTVQRQTFEDLHLTSGQSIDQSFRNSRELAVAPRATYALHSATALFLGLSINRLETIKPSALHDRSANTYTILGGVHFDLDKMLVAEVGLGWRARNYDMPYFKPFNGFTYDATLDWYPTELMSVRAEAHQDFENSGLITVAAIPRDTQRATVYYDPLRRLRTSVSLERSHDSYREIGVSTTLWTASTRASYLVTPRLTATIYGQYQSKSSTDASRIGAFHGAVFGLAFSGRL
jgi:hypothetical protein